MLPTPRLLKHHQYFLPESSTELEHSGRTHLRDFQEYHQRLAALHHAYLHGWGIVSGLDVGVSPTDSHALTIQPGIALDRAGQLIVLSAHAESRAFVGAAQAEIAPPFVIDVRDLNANRTYNLTIQSATELNNADQIEFLPWFQFNLADEPPAAIAEGTALILALIRLDAEGKIAALHSEDPAFVHRRHMMGGQGVETISIQRSIVQDGVIQTHAVAQIGAGKTTELRVTVSNPTADIVFAHADGGHFGRLDVQADAVQFAGGVGIGTAAPATGLHVIGDLRAAGGLQVGGPITLADGAEASVLRVTGNLALEGNLSVTGTVAGRNIAGDGARLDAHIGRQDNPHGVTATQVGALASTGGHLSGALIIAGTLSVGTTGADEQLEVAGRVKSGALTVGPWPANPNAYVFFGANTLNQAEAGNYALLQDVAGAGRGRTYLNSPVDIRFRIGNVDKMTLDNGGNLAMTGNLSFGAQVRQMLNLWRAEYGIGVQGWTQYFRTHGNFAWYRDGVHADGELNSGGGVLQMVIRRNDRVGIGTADPGGSLHISTPHNWQTPQLKVTQQTNTDWARIVLESAGNEFHLAVGGPRSSTPNVFHVWSVSARRNILTVSHRNHVGIMHENPDHPLHMGGGAFCEGGRTWKNASSITYKTNVSPLPLTVALDTLAGLTPVTFRYKEEAAQTTHVGFIAEDVPDLVASIDRKGLSALEIVGVLTRVVQHQQAEISALKTKLLDS
ncbi:MAG: tail fiber domain-containing protein [Caldilineaceae bacterium]